MDFAVIMEGDGDDKKNVEGIVYTAMEDGGYNKKNGEGILYSTVYLPERDAHPEYQQVFALYFCTAFFIFPPHLE
jgi:hypothetical protein